MYRFGFQRKNRIEAKLDDGLKYRCLFFPGTCGADYRENVNMFEISTHCETIAWSEVPKDDCFSWDALTLFRLHFYY